MTRQEHDAWIVDLHLNGLSRKQIQQRLGFTPSRVARPIRAYAETMDKKSV